MNEPRLSKSLRKPLIVYVLATLGAGGPKKEMTFAGVQILAPLDHLVAFD